MLRNNYLYTEKCLFILDESPDLCEKILSEYSFFLPGNFQPYFKTV